MAKRIQNNAWNLYKDDGKQFGYTFDLDVDQYAEVLISKMCECDQIVVVEIDFVGSLECSPINTATLAYDDCNPMILKHPVNKARIPGPGIFRLQRIEKDGEIQGMHMEALVRIYTAKENKPIIESKGFCHDTC